MLKDAYAGTFYDDQKKDLLDQFVKSNLPLPEAAVTLKNLLTAGFIDVTELSLYTTKLLSVGSVVQQPVAVVQQVVAPIVVAPPVVDNKIIWNGVEIEPNTKLSIIDSTIINRLSADANQIKDIIALLMNLGVETLKDAVELYKNHKKFNVLVDLMQVTKSFPTGITNNSKDDQQDLFEKIIQLLTDANIPFVIDDLDKFKNQQTDKVRNFLEISLIFPAYFHSKSRRNATIDVSFL
jgi:hypothetical protein